MVGQAAKPDAGFQTARTAYALELRKSGRQLPLQQREAAGQRRGGTVKELDYSSGCMFPEGQGAFNRAAAPRQGMLRGRESSIKRMETGGHLIFSDRAQLIFTRSVMQNT